MVSTWHVGDGSVVIWCGNFRLTDLWHVGIILITWWHVKYYFEPLYTQKYDVYMVAWCWRTFIMCWWNVGIEIYSSSLYKIHIYIIYMWPCVYMWCGESLSMSNLLRNRYLQIYLFKYFIWTSLVHLLKHFIEWISLVYLT